MSNPQDKLNVHSFSRSYKQDTGDMGDNFKTGDFSSKYFSRRSSVYATNSLKDELPQNSPHLRRVEGGFEDKTTNKEPAAKKLTAQQSLNNSLNQQSSSVQNSFRRPSMNLANNVILAPIPSEPVSSQDESRTQSPRPNLMDTFRRSNNSSPVKQLPHSTSNSNFDVLNPDPNSVEIVGRHLVSDQDASSVRSGPKRAITVFNDDSLQLQGGDISREVYNWQREHAGQGGGDLMSRRRSQSFSGSIADSIPTPDFQVQDIRVPGGFRRSFLIQKQARQGLLDDDSKPTFITRNFIEFLTLYGHFAGEELRDEEDEDEEEEVDGGDEESLLLPSVRPKRHADQHKATTIKAVLLLLKAFMGTGVLFLPRGFRNGGWLFAIVALVFFSVLSYYCFMQLINVRIHLGASSYGDIAHTLYGNRLRQAILASIVLSQIGFSAAYIIFTATNLQAFTLSIWDKKFGIEFYIVLQLVIFIPLSLTRRISKLSGTALVADLFIFLGLLYVFYHCSFVLAREGMATVTKFNKDWTVFIGTAIFTYEGIGLLIPIQESMQKPSKFPTILAGVMTTATISFVLIGSIGYFAFGNETDTVILLNFPTDSMVVSIIQFLYATAILLSTPLQLFPAIRILENGLIKKSGKYDSSIKWQKNYFRISFVFLTALIAWGGASDLDKFVAIVGSFACIPLIYIFPPLLHLKALAETTLSKSTDVVIVIFGFVIMAYTSAQTVSEWIH